MLKRYVPIVFLSAMVLLTGCQSKKAEGNKAPSMPPPEVGVVSIRSEVVPLTVDLPGRLEAYRTAQVRARATGIILKRAFEEGADVSAGDVLFEIDPAPLQANYNMAKASLARAESTFAQVQSKAKRYKDLVAIHAVSEQDFEDITALTNQSQADVQGAKATLETASLNLSYATVTAPISGRIGAAKVTEGALVSQQEATQLAVIQQLDPIKFNFTQSSTELLRLRRAMEQGQLQSIATGEVKVSLLLEDGTVYSEPGKLLFSDVTVDPTTGMVTLQAEFPNPDHLLLPGMFGRARIEQAVNTQAIIAPQRAVAIGPSGSATVMVVTDENKVEARSIKLDTAIKDQWIVKEGLKAGEKVIVEGLQKVRPDMTVNPVPFQPNTNKSTAQAG